MHKSRNNCDVFGLAVWQTGWRHAQGQPTVVVETGGRQRFSGLMTQLYRPTGIRSAETIVCLYIYTEQTVYKGKKADCSLRRILRIFVWPGTEPVPFRKDWEYESVSDAFDKIA
jgi:hypothetical protein